MLKMADTNETSDVLDYEEEEQIQNVANDGSQNINNNVTEEVKGAFV